MAKVKKIKRGTIKRTKSLKAKRKVSHRNSKKSRKQPRGIEISIHDGARKKDDALDVTGNDTGGDGCDGSDELDRLPDEDDLALVDDEMGEALMFLTGIETTLQKESKETPCKSRKRKRENTEQEASFELQPRHRPKIAGVNGEEAEDTEVHHLLPIKNAAGLVRRTEVRKKQQDSEDSWGTDDKLPRQDEAVSSVDSEGTVGVEETRVPLTAAQAVVQRERKLAARKQEMAKYCDAIMEDPERNVSLLKRLRSFCEEREPDVCVTVRKLAMVSLMTVFIDILPGYRIQSATEAQQGVKLSKDVKKLRSYEESLLHNYQLYLTLLADSIYASDRAKHKANGFLQLNNGMQVSTNAVQRLRSVAVNCMCQLLIAHPHFNFRNNLLTVVVPLMNDRSADSKVALWCCDAVAQLFEQDFTGDASVEALKIITRLIKSKSYRIRREILDTFLHLQIQDVPATGETKNHTQSKEQKKAEQRRVRRVSKREKRRMQEKVRLERELKETQAVESKEKRTRMQTEAIKLVFSTYFRILKNAQDSTLLSSVLKGLGKFAHLINVDFLADLTNILGNIASSKDVSAEDSLQCVLAAFNILSGQGEVLTFDPHRFYVCFYRLLLDPCSQEQRLVLVAMECLDMLFKKRKQISTQRILAFMKRLCTVSLMSEPATAVGMLAATRLFLQAYPKSEQLLDSEAALTGVFRADIDDPDLSNAGSTTLWELSLLLHHYDAQVLSYAQHIAMGAPSAGKGSLPPVVAKRELCEVVKHATKLDWKYAFPRMPSLTHMKEEQRVKDKPLLHPERFEIQQQ